MGTFVSVSQREFESAILPLGFKPVSLDGTKEFVYGKRMDCNGSAFTVRVYSGVDIRTGVSREVGSDAIRVCMVGRNSDGSIYGVCKDRRVNRTKNWALNLRERLSHFDCDAVHSCPKCNAPLALRKGKNGDFLGCSEYRVTGCKGSRNA